MKTETQQAVTQKLALQLAQAAYDKAVVDTELEQANARIAELEQKLEGEKK